MDNNVIEDIINMLNKRFGHEVQLSQHGEMCKSKRDEYQSHSERYIKISMNVYIEKMLT